MGLGRPLIAIYRKQSILDIKNTVFLIKR